VFYVKIKFDHIPINIAVLSVMSFAKPFENLIEFCSHTTKLSLVPEEILNDRRNVKFVSQATFILQLTNGR